MCLLVNYILRLNVNKHQMKDSLLQTVWDQVSNVFLCKRTSFLPHFHFLFNSWPSRCNSWLYSPRFMSTALSYKHTRTPKSQTHTHTQKHTYTHTHKHTRKHTHTQITHTHTHTQTHSQTHAHPNTRTPKHTYTHTNTNTLTHAHPNTHTSYITSAYIHKLLSRKQVYSCNSGNPTNNIKEKMQKWNGGKESNEELTMPFTYPLTKPLWYFSTLRFFRTRSSMQINLSEKTPLCKKIFFISNHFMLSSNIFQLFF